MGHHESNKRPVDADARLEKEAEEQSADDADIKDAEANLAVAQEFGDEGPAEDAALED